jgi:hypothetical protein
MRRRDAGDPDEFLVVLGLFRALEAACDGPGLPDPTVDDLYESVIAELDGGQLDRGWHLVAARLRAALLEHAAELGCDCGSLAWLEKEQLYHAEHLPEEE